MGMLSRSAASTTYLRTDKIMIYIYISESLLWKREFIQKLPSIWTLQYGRDTATIALPHCSESSLPSKIPKFYSYISFCNFAHVEANLVFFRECMWQYVDESVGHFIIYLFNQDTYSRNHVFAVTSGLMKIKVKLVPWNDFRKRDDRKHGKIWSSLTAMALTRDVFPAFWRPMRESSISCLKNRLKGGKKHQKHKQFQNMSVNRILSHWRYNIFIED